MTKSTLDKDLGKVVKLETVTYSVTRSMAMPGLLLVFFNRRDHAGEPVRGRGAAELVRDRWRRDRGLYGAQCRRQRRGQTIMGPAVGSRALTLGGALVIAAFCEAAGAILAGGDVVNTRLAESPAPGRRDAGPAIHPGDDIGLSGRRHVDPPSRPISAPRSRRPIPVVGGVVGAGIAAAGFWVVHWPMIGTIVASWVDLAGSRRVDRRGAARLREMVDPVPRGSRHGSKALGSGDGRAL